MEDKIKAADEAEEKAKEEYNKACKEAEKEFGVATHEGFMEFNRACLPFREKWEKFMRPFLDEMAAKCVEADQVRMASLEKINSNWGKCPACGKSFNRHQMFCSNEKCGERLELKED